MSKQPRPLHTATSYPGDYVVDGLNGATNPSSCKAVNVGNTAVLCRIYSADHLRPSWPKVLFTQLCWMKPLLTILLLLTHQQTETYLALVPLTNEPLEEFHSNHPANLNIR
jgi:hypothetical protein